MSLSFFRYPGGKSKLKNLIISYLDVICDGNILEYREPFFGGGSIGLEYMRSNPFLDDIWINDFDSGISALWTSVLRYPDELKAKVRNFIPSIEKFDEFKLSLRGSIDDHTVVDYGFMKLAIHQISYSGLGLKSGGPLGGRSTDNYAGSKVIKYPIDCRWSPDYICKKIDTLHRLFGKLRVHGGYCSSYDFGELLVGSNCLLYLDPPYYLKGGELYHHSFSISDHERLSRMLRGCTHSWLLSYDDCSEIRELYDWAMIDVIDVNYSITALGSIGCNRLSTTKGELIIYPKILGDIGKVVGMGLD